jgi:hypothetical protein
LAEEGNAEVVPLPDDTPPPPPPEPPRVAPKKEPPKTPEPTPAKKEEPKAPEPAPATKAEPVVVEPKGPKDDPPPPPIAPVEPPAETVPLPATAPPPRPATGAAVATAPVEPASDALVLVADNPAVPPGGAAVFSLYGPEAHLRAATARYVLRDELGRDVTRGELKVCDLPYTEGKPRKLKIEIKQPLAPQHVLELSLTGADGWQAQASSRVQVPVPQPWDAWMALISAPPESASPAAWTTLRALGIRGGLQYRLHPARREALRKGGAPFYVENIGRQLLSRYHTERGLWEKTIAAIAAAPNDRAPLMREPSLCSQGFADAFAKDLKRHADAYAQDPPLFYSLACEPSVTRLAAAADFDFSPAALQEFQRWLERDVYGTVKALNASWGTQFQTWDEVVPMTTDEARMRLRDGVLNMAPWVDFRTFQDHAFSKVLRDGAEFIRQIHPGAKVGITGAMGPFAFGGWDWARLARALDVVECYDIGGARALWRDMAPGKPALAAVSVVETEPATDALRTIWSLALEGGPRGVLVWDEPTGENGKRALLDAEGKPTALAEALAPALKTLDGETGTLLANSARAHDGVAVLYSPASVRVHWLLEAHRLHGDKWLQAWGADTSAERRESPQLRLRESWTKLLDDLGLTWRFVSSTQLENKDILRPDARIKTIVLPQAIALSDREADALTQFVQQGGSVVADCLCGRFDEHGRLREKPALDELFQVDTSAEPFSPRPMNPLEKVRTAAGAPPAAYLTPEHLAQLPPVFSDGPKRIGKTKPELEYRRSPVLATGKPGAVFLNLDLTDYLRWRLHPDQPRAKAVREVLAGAAFAARLTESAIDWQKTRVPAGTQVTWLRVCGAPETSRVLALRRNPQTRLHELGTEGDGNWAFEKAESFALALRAPAFVTPLASPAPLQDAGRPAAATQNVEGTLDPIAPALFVVSAEAPKAPAITVSNSARPGQAFDITVTSGAGAGVCLFNVRLFGPDGRERSYHAATKLTSDGATVHTVPLAFNEPAGQWRIVARDLVRGAAATNAVDVK